MDEREKPGIFTHDLETAGSIRAYGGGISQLFGPLTIRDWVQLPQLASDPTTTNWGATEKGRAWINTTSDVVKYWDGSAIQTFVIAISSLQNLIKNGSFESWSAGAAAAPDGWSIVGAGASIAREGTIVKHGVYSAKLTRSGANCRIEKNIYVDVGEAYCQGRTFTIGCWAYATVVGRARITVGDDAGGTYSSFHPGDSVWHFLTVTRTMDAAASFFNVKLYIENGDTDVYFDGGMCVEGPAVLSFTPNPVDWGDNVPNTISAAPTDVGKVGEVRFYRSGTTRRIYMCDGTDWKYQAIAT